jgi:hypothetical protein
MSNTIFAEGCNVLTGDVNNNNPCNHKYGEVHTDDAWIPARDRFCTNPHHPTIPVGLIVFGDKIHTNLHGTLALTPIIFTLTLFSQTARNNTSFWRPIGYIPNLSVINKIRFSSYWCEVVIGACVILSSRGLSEWNYLSILGTLFHPSPFVSYMVDIVDNSPKEN